ncbi:MAG: N-acetylmuramoyl-L-alanine amidase [Chloroflexi bacterium]|nr:MAG: N-acetylmuramoyl-L-alanine amidase [Chloroflexota bacterium]
MQQKNKVVIRVLLIALPVCLALATIAGLQIHAMQDAKATTENAKNVNQAFDQASQQFGVPVALLKAICYMEGRLSNHGSAPSIDGGYGCMHLVTNSFETSLPRGIDGGLSAYLTKNNRANILEKAAQTLGVTPDQLKKDMATNIRGGAAILLGYALLQSPNHTAPSSLADWYGAVAAYSNASTQSAARMYADHVYKLIASGFSATTDTGETVTLAPQPVQPHVVSTGNTGGDKPLPQGCVDDGKTEFPGAINCIVDPKFDCKPLPDDAPCTYLGADRPKEFALNLIGIHDIEGTAQNALNVFQDIQSGVSIHYIVDSDGTVYQMLHEKDIAFHIGNRWYNEHSIGIEHAGFAATGFLWYNATEYLASAKLSAYLAKKYHIPADHDHIVSHGTVPSPSLATPPNHVDPGSYWLWEFYLKQIYAQDPAPTKAKHQRDTHVFSLHPDTGRRPLGQAGTETAANFNFFYLYNGPNTRSGLISRLAGDDITDETTNVEANISYYSLAKVPDQAGTGNTMYQIWYSVTPRPTPTSTPTPIASPTGTVVPTVSPTSTPTPVATPTGTVVPTVSPTNTLTPVATPTGTVVPTVSPTSTPTPTQPPEHAILAWLAVPPGSVESGSAGTAIALQTDGSAVAKVFGRPTASDTNVIGDAPKNAVFVSAFTVIEDGTHNLWYEINYNHRQAWVPATEVSKAPVLP